ncbi:hypothetical protein GE061_007282 [Apolygus lucorum]|uniref:Uncharacterized protein n=1 Tax=Apolygus lucorum TaxID=248454 RepID=A0A8S9WRH6_APOLU|nr:hypothetical protein GE061_007282 [Apolygus lucorum]
MFLVDELLLCKTIGKKKSLKKNLKKIKNEEIFTRKSLMFLLLTFRNEEQLLSLSKNSLTRNECCAHWFVMRCFRHGKFHSEINAIVELAIECSI